MIKMNNVIIEGCGSSFTVGGIDCGPEVVARLTAESEAKDRLISELREANNQYRDRYIAAEAALRHRGEG